MMNQTLRDHNTEIDTKLSVAEATTTGQTTGQGGQQPVEREVGNAAPRRRKRQVEGIGGLQPRPEYKPFADALRVAMARSQKTASDLAREIWGSTTDKRGYSVGRNRDRIGHYLNGTSYPEPDNLEKLARALGIPVSELTIERPAGSNNPGPRARHASSTYNIQAQPDGTIRLQIDKVITADWEAIARIMQQLQQLEQPAVNPLVGTVVPGGKDDNDTPTRQNG